jgi:iron complex transport system permease protein
VTPLVALTVLLLLAIVLAIRVGAVGIDTAAVVRALLGDDGGTTGAIVRRLRAPRALQAALTGGALALAGTCYQALLRNPLADPYTLGITSGASLGAVLAVVLGLATFGVWTLPVAGLVGALLALVLVIRVAYAADGVLDRRTMLLSGIAVGSFSGALVMLIVSLADDQSYRTAMFWIMGTLAGATWEQVVLLAAVLAAAALALLPQARALNLLAIGESTAATLGVEVERAKWTTLLVASALTAAAVAVAGTVGFVGLVIPHMLRLLWGSDHRLLLPASVLAGASFVVLADLAARTVVAPSELPLGVITALVGVPVFVVLLRRRSPT